MDVKAICEKYGISSPSQVIEMLTICGDTADNVPGVKGVGEVGAGKLIAKYGTVKNIYEHISELSARQQVMFREAEQHIGLSHDLVTIKTDIDLPEEDMHVAPAFTPEVAELFSHYEFNSLRKLIPDASGAGLQTKNVQSALSQMLMNPEFSGKQQGLRWPWRTGSCPRRWHSAPRLNSSLSWKMKI